jgi:hypothetical protein
LVISSVDLRYLPSERELGAADQIIQAVDPGGRFTPILGELIFLGECDVLREETQFGRKAQ